MNRQAKRARRHQRREVRLEGLLRFLLGVEVEISIPTPRDEPADKFERLLAAIDYDPPDDGGGWADDVIRDVKRL